jgi:hypothetical protein
MSTQQLETVALRIKLKLIYLIDSLLQLSQALLSGRWVTYNFFNAIIPLSHLVGQSTSLSYTIFCRSWLFGNTGSAVPCERVFSSAKETITMRCNRMGYNLMEALQMLKFTLRNHRILDFFIGLTKKEKILELEQLPDDIFTAASNPVSDF